MVTKEKSEKKIASSKGRVLQLLTRRRFPRKKGQKRERELKVCKVKAVIRRKDSNKRTLSNVNLHKEVDNKDTESSIFTILNFFNMIVSTRVFN